METWFFLNENFFLEIGLENRFKWIKDGGKKKFLKYRIVVKNIFIYRINDINCLL